MIDIVRLGYYNKIPSSGRPILSKHFSHFWSLGIQGAGLVSGERGYSRMVPPGLVFTLGRVPVT